MIVSMERVRTFHGWTPASLAISKTGVHPITPSIMNKLIQD
jgi:hypothetical protein